MIIDYLFNGKIQKITRGIIRNDKFNRETAFTETKKLTAGDAFVNIYSPKIKMFKVL